MIMASGVNFGVTNTLPHIFGVAIGVFVVIVLAGFGMGELLNLFPAAWDLMLAISISYILYLAWKIASACPSGMGRKAASPLTCIQAIAFQWINPKVWALGVTAVTIFAQQTSLFQILVVAFAFAIIGLVSNTFWAWFGALLSSFLLTGKRLRVFNIFAAVLLLLSFYYVLFLQSKH